MIKDREPLWENLDTPLAEDDEEEEGFCLRAGYNVKVQGASVGVVDKFIASGTYGEVWVINRSADGIEDQAVKVVRENPRALAQAVLHREKLALARECEALVHVGAHTSVVSLRFATEQEIGGAH